MIPKKEKADERIAILGMIPNMVTLFNLFTGFFALLAICDNRIEYASWLILLAMIWDSLDGNIARIFKNPTLLGKELDSLADTVSFVVAPCVLMMRTIPHSHSPWMLAAVLFYLTAGSYRLARFNLHPPAKSYFEGLPTPAAALTLVMTVLAFQKRNPNDLPTLSSLIDLLLFLAAFLMVSKISYPKLTGIKFSQWQSLLYLAAAVFIIVLKKVNLETSLASVCAIFIFLGPFYCQRAASGKEISD